MVLFEGMNEPRSVQEDKGIKRLYRSHRLLQADAKGYETATHTHTRMDIHAHTDAHTSGLTERIRGQLDICIK